MTVIPIVIGALGTVTKGLVQGLEDLEIRVRVETSQTRALLWSARKLRRVLETWDSLSWTVEYEGDGDTMDLVSLEKSPKYWKKRLELLEIGITRRSRQILFIYIRERPEGSVFNIDYTEV